MNRDFGKNPKVKTLYLALFLFFAFSFLIVAFFKVQVIENEKWAFLADRQHYFYLQEPFSRGTFFSNTEVKKGHPQTRQPFAIDITKFHLFVDSKAIPTRLRGEVADHILQITQDKGAKRDFLIDQMAKKSRSRRLIPWLSVEQKDALIGWWQPFAREHAIAKNALFFIKDFKRSYPFGKMLGQVLHTVREFKNEKTMESFPTGGLELEFNRYLKGKLGKRRMLRSPRHALELGTVLEEPENGADVYLTINHYLQSIAEEELAKGVKKRGAKGGYAVMMNPKSGEILALAQYPFFDPAEYARYFNDPLLENETKVKAITDASEPGSVMKPVFMAVALRANEELQRRGEHPFFSPEEKVPTYNGFFRGRTQEIQDVGRRHSFLNMYLGIQKSSNVYCFRLVERLLPKLGDDWFRDQYAEVFEFGKKTGIELPGEAAGVVPKPGKLHPNGKLEWSVPTPYSLAIGYNLQVNALQILRVYGALANGGYLVKPTLVKKIVKNGEVLVKNDPLLFPKKKIFSEAVTKEVVKAIKSTTKERGSGSRGEINGYSEGGKTGTSRKLIGGTYSKKHHNVKFIGIAPINKPEFVLIVGLEEPRVEWIPGVGYNHHAGVAAAPIFREIARRSLEYLGVPPDDPSGYPEGNPRHGEDADWFKETKELNALYDKWNG